MLLGAPWLHAAACTACNVSPRRMPFLFLDATPTWWQALTLHHLLHAMPSAQTLSMLQPISPLRAHMPQTKHLDALEPHWPRWCRNGGHAEQALWGRAVGPVPAGHRSARLCLRGPLGAGWALHATGAGLHCRLRCSPAERGGQTFPAALSLPCQPACAAASLGQDSTLSRCCCVHCPAALHRLIVCHTSVFGTCCPPEAG